MPKFRVTFAFKTYQEYSIEAKDADEARELAWEQYGSDEPNSEYEGDSDIDDIEPESLEDACHE